MIQLIEKIIRLRNPDFRMHSSVSVYLVISFTLASCMGVMRGLKLWFYGRNPKIAILGKNTSFFYLPMIRFGKMLKLGDYVHLNALGQKGIDIGNEVGIGAFSRVVVSTSLDQPGLYIKIGHRVGIGEYAYLGGGGGLEIGDECIIGQYFSCHPENHITSDIDIAIRHQGVTRKGIKIGKNCWIGSKVTILDGVEIGEGSVIAAGAVVHQSFPPYSFIGGIPAKLLKSRI